LNNSQGKYNQTERSVQLKVNYFLSEIVFFILKRI